MTDCVGCWFYGMGDGTCMCPYSEHLYEVRVSEKACEDFTPEEGKEGTLWAYDPAELPEDDERYVPRTAEGIPHRADRLKAIGNGQVPSAAALAETILQRALEKYR